MLIRKRGVDASRYNPLQQQYNSLNGSDKGLNPAG